MISGEEKSSLKKQVEQMLARSGLRLFEFKVYYRGPTAVLRVLADHEQGGVTLEECAGCNRSICAQLEKEAVLGEDFEVEVYSPGVDMKLKTTADFKRVRGRVLSFWLIQPVKGATYIEGVLEQVEDECVLVEGKGKIPRKLIKCAKQRIDHE